jgi:DnaJ-class molecular chaperone
MGSPLHIDSFSTKLSDLRGSARRDPRTVFDAILAQGGRFSAFEIERGLEKSVTSLFQRGYLRDKDKRSYPWCECEATPLGTAWREGRKVLCTACDAKGYIITKRVGRNIYSDRCPECDGTSHVDAAPGGDR